uniref:Uncharacterized protein n=1 Tax=Cacopsylla melanoneura TaxID=428564 RepID=A0A8D9E6E3_9HEMI
MATTTSVLFLTLLLVTGGVCIDTLIRPETTEEDEDDYDQYYAITPPSTTTRKPRKKEFILEIYDELIRDPKLDLDKENVWNTVARFARKMGIKNYRRDVLKTYRSVDATDPIMIYMPSGRVREKWVEAYRRGVFMNEQWYMARRDYGERNIRDRTNQTETTSTVKSNV